MKSGSKYRRSNRRMKSRNPRNRFSHPVRIRASRIRRSSERYISAQERYQEHLRIKRAAMVSEERWNAKKADRRILVSKNVKSQRQKSPKHLSTRGRPDPLIVEKKGGSAEGDTYSKALKIAVFFAVTTVLVVMIAILIVEALLS